MSSQAKANGSSRRPTLHDVARAVGVSATTVSNVLNRRGSVGREVAERVQEAASRIGYRTNHSAKAVRTGRTYSIGLILPDLTNPFFPLLAQSIQASAKRFGYAVLLVDSQGYAEWEHDGAQDLLSRGVDGILWCPANQENSLADLQRDVPVVTIDRPVAGYDLVCADNYGGAFANARRLIEIGNRRIGLISGPLTFPNALDRRNGSVDGVRDMGEILWESENPFSQNLTAEVCALLDRRDVSAVICGNDLIALGVIRHLLDAGARVPDDIAVTGFDDISWASLCEPSLTTVRQPFISLGQEAVSVLRARIGGGQGVRRRIQLDMDLVERASSRRLTSMVPETFA